MAELTAQGATPNEFWRRTLPAQAVTLGRSEAKSIWAVPWDKQVSGLHAALSWQGGKLHISRFPEARNRIFFQGQALDEFDLEPGQQFIIGQTTFSLEDSQPDLPTPNSELTISPQELVSVAYDQPNERIEVLAALPAVIRHSPSEEGLEEEVLKVLLRGIPRAEAAAVVRLESRDPSRVEVRRRKGRGLQAAGFSPSRRLAVDAITRRRQSVLHIWHAGSLRPEVTMDPHFDWALCVPLADEPSPGWGLYVAGRIDQAADAPPHQEVLKSDLKFTELVAEIFSSLRQVLDLQRRQSLLARFLSRPVLAALAEKDMDEVLRPREAEITVLFCDLRGSCQLAEEGQHELMQLWDRVSEALNIMASSIIDQDGVIGDFQGDAAMGFWGWPLDCDDHVERAARAALMIRRRFAHAARQPDNPLASISCGIGIATGRAVAGKLGTSDQFKVSVFGPMVNLASRLESMTKHFRVPILLDEHSANILRQSTHSYWARCRRLARVQPFGMKATILTVSELLPPAVEAGAMPERNRRDYEAGLDAFLESRWTDAAGLLERLPGDGPTEFLQAFMDRNQGTPPANWDGVIPMGIK